MLSRKALLFVSADSAITSSCRASSMALKIAVSSSDIRRRAHDGALSSPWLHDASGAVSTPRLAVSTSAEPASSGTGCVSGKWTHRQWLMAWQPSTEGLSQLLGLFKASSRADNAQHRAIQQQLTDFNAIPDYNNYLVFIMNMTQEEGPVRQMAGLVLKNNIKEHWNGVHPQFKE